MQTTMPELSRVSAAVDLPSAIQLRRARWTVRNHERNLLSHPERKEIILERYHKARAMLDRGIAATLAHKLVGQPAPWVYGPFAVVRAVNGVFCLSTDIHGGTRNLRGSWPTVQSAIGAATRIAEMVLCLVPGENAGDSTRVWRNQRLCASSGIYVSPKFSALTGFTG